MEMMRYEVVTRDVTTADGYRLLAGCICRQQAAEVIGKGLEELSDYRVKSKDAYGIDFELAARMGSLAHMSVIAAGASLGVDDAGLPEGVTTGGVLGDPAEKPESSDEDVVDLSENFYMYTVPGGPGLAANSFGDTVRQALLEIRSIGFEELDEEKFRFVMRKYGITVALLVFDGTGSGRHAKIGAMDLNGVRILE